VRDEKNEIDSILGKYDSSYHNSGVKIIESMFTKPVLYSEELFEYFGAETVVSIDYSDYEGASIIHDMNVVSSIIHRLFV
jgi:hypothetical protein